MSEEIDENRSKPIRSRIPIDGYKPKIGDFLEKQKENIFIPSSSLFVGKSGTKSDAPRVASPVELGSRERCFMQSLIELYDTKKSSKRKRFRLRNKSERDSAQQFAYTFAKKVLKATLDELLTHIEFKEDYDSVKKILDMIDTN